MGTIQTKICGITETTGLDAAINPGARFIGFVFYPQSSRAIEPAMAAGLIRAMPAGTEAVGLFVDPDDTLVERACAAGITMIQIHGHERPARVSEIKTRFHLPVMKALRIATAADLEQIKDYEGIADWFLFDAKVDGQEGGTGHSFDWTILQDFQSETPWMLAGGLNAGNINDALKIVTPNAVDVSSGVESAPGIKDPAKIKEFIDAVRASR